MMHATQIHQEISRLKGEVNSIKQVYDEGLEDLKLLKSLDLQVNNLRSAMKDVQKTTENIDRRVESLEKDMNELQSKDDSRVGLSPKENHLHPEISLRHSDALLSKQEKSRSFELGGSPLLDDFAKKLAERSQVRDNQQFEIIAFREWTLQLCLL
jgi:hypothetical protein